MRTAKESMLFSVRPWDLWSPHSLISYIVWLRNSMFCETSPVPYCMAQEFASWTHVNFGSLKTLCLLYWGLWIKLCSKKSLNLNNIFLYSYIKCLTLWYIKYPKSRRAENALKIRITGSNWSSYRRGTYIAQDRLREATAYLELTSDQGGFRGAENLRWNVMYTRLGWRV